MTRFLIPALLIAAPFLVVAGVQSIAPQAEAAGTQLADRYERYCAADPSICS